ncbi:MAG: hypothetical protein E3K36_17270 [Candidatus Brocadia sp.]|nr:hypothetical protein [Candidatus Brocadia sp.]
MTMQQDEKYRVLKRKHQQLLRRWSKNNGPCIVCGEGVVNEKDHLPPKVLFPVSLRNPKTEFFTFPVCTPCNRTSSDEDFLFSVQLSMGLTQESIINNQEPSDPDLLALYNQTRGHLVDPEKAEHRRELLRNYIDTDPKTGRVAMDTHTLPTHHTLTKIVKSIYWLHTEGHVLQKYNPGWWILSRIDTSKTNYIEKHLMTTHADIYWEDRFISHFSFGHPQHGVGGFISCSLHFYTRRKVGNGMSWHIFASPKNTILNGTSLYELCASIWGPATIKPQE